MKSCVLAPLALAAGLATTPFAAQATVVFDFSWSNATLAMPEPTLTATGTMTIDKSAGETFTALDISFVEITVDGGLLGSFVIDDWTTGGGLIDASGAFATWDPTSEPFFFSDDGSTTTALGSGFFFGCAGIDCGNSGGLDNPILVQFGSGTPGQFVEYASAALAAGSMTLTASPVPLPASLPLTAAGLAALAWIARRRAA